MNIDIEKIELSVRAYNCLKKAGVKTINDMAIINLNELTGCGVATRKEISDKIIYFKENGYYTPDFIKKYLVLEKSEDYVDTLPLSNRSKNILKKLYIENAEQMLLLNEDILYRARNSGKSSVNEIINYINKNKDMLISEQNNNENFVLSHPINKIMNFSGQTKLSVFALSNQLKNELYNNDIITVNDLLINKIQPTQINSKEYNNNYDYFFNIAYGNFVLKLSDSIKKCSVLLPFNLIDYNRHDVINVNELINYILKNFDNFSLKEKINSKLYLYWLSTFKEIDIMKNLIDSFNLDDRTKDVLIKRTYMTLEEIGEKYNITKERVRQIESRALHKIKEKYLLFPFKVLDLKKIYYIEQSSDDELILLYLNEIFDKDFIKLKSDDEIYFLPLFQYYKLNEYINDNIQELEHNGYLYYDQYDNIDLLLKILDYMKLNFYENKIFRKYSKRLYVKYAMRKMNRAINISNDIDLDELIITVKSLFGIVLEKTRGLESLIIDAGVRVSSGTYAADDHIIPLDNKILDNICSYIKEKEIINTRDLFIEFGDILNQHNLNNEVILYRYLKENLLGKLYFHGISAVITSNETISGWGDVVIRIISETKKPINKLDFMVKYSVTEAVYANLPINYNDIIIWSGKELYLKSLLNISDKLLEKLKRFIDAKQIVSFLQIKQFLLENEENIMKKNNINNDINLYYFLQNVLGINYNVDRKNEEVRTSRKRKMIIEEKYDKVEELTL